MSKLQPKAPVIARACYLLECAHFVHQCNRGQWPSWIKMNLPGPNRPSRMAGPMTPAQQQQMSAQTRRTQVLQLQAAKMFHAWAEMLGARIEEMMAEEQSAAGAAAGVDHVAMVTDEARQRQLAVEDDEEDFLDEASVAGAGKPRCPMALRLVACVLLLEITTFLREAYRCLPKPHSLGYHQQQKTSYVILFMSFYP